MTWTTLNDVVTTVRACRGQTPYGQTQQKIPYIICFYFIFFSLHHCLNFAKLTSCSVEDLRLKIVTVE